MENASDAGFVILCDANGVTLDILLDRIGIARVLKPGQPLALVFDTASVEKSLDFLRAVKQEGAAFDWELNLNIHDDITVVFFVGGMVDENILVVGSSSRNGINLRFYEEIMRINHEQVNGLRAMMKSRSLEQSTGDRLEIPYYHEFMEFNNRLINTQRELAKRNVQLQTEHERQRIISELVSDYAFAFVVEPEQRLRLEWMTEAFSLITGYDVPTGTKPLDDWVDVLFPGADHAACQHLERCMAGHAGRCELTITTRDGEQRFLQASCKPVLDPDTGQVVRLYGAAQDITQQILAEQQAHALALEREHSQILAEFFQGALHEFGTPLTTIKTDIYLLNASATTPRQKTSIERLKHQIAAIQRLIDTLAMMTRLDVADVDLAYNEFQPAQLVGDVCASLANRARESEVTLTHSAADTLPLLHGDYKYLRFALDALVDNAIRYTLPGGTVHVTAEHQDDMLAFVVRDTGIGIAAEDMPRIFERFWRKDEARSKRGFGLGLSIARKIVECHHGQLTVSSTPEQGSTFHMRLPLHPST